MGSQGSILRHRNHLGIQAGVIDGVVLRQHILTIGLYQLCHLSGSIYAKAHAAFQSPDAFITPGQDSNHPGNGVLGGVCGRGSDGGSSGMKRGDEGVVIAYGSMYGNTEQMAEAIAAELSAQGIKNIVMHNVSKSNPSYIIADIFKYRGLIIGSPTYSNQIYPEIESLLSKILVREVKGRYLGYFGSFCWAGAAVKRMGEFAEKSKFEIVGDPVEMKQAMKDITYEQCENLARAMADRLKKDR